MTEARITYIYHSCFVVETTEHVLLFDYYRDAPDACTLVSDMFAAWADKQVLVFASHGHSDHFSPAIFNWPKLHPRIHYVLSSDMREVIASEQITVLGPGTRAKIGEVEVQTLKSTDLGVAFLVMCDKMSFFHAGDLNWWHWEGEPEEDNQAMAEDYKRQVNLLAKYSIDVAFVPVDPRLHTHYSLGIAYFLQVTNARVVLPMHFGDDYAISRRLHNDLPPEQASRIVEISALGQITTHRKQLV